jgi:hypothetical protein
MKYKKTSVLALLLSILVLPAFSQAAQKTVCTVTINSSDEKQSFIRNLPAGDFKFVELTDYDTTTKGAERGESQWFKNACEARVQCDVLMVSAHFGGFFFGATGYQLGVPSLEQKSCSNSCDGILKKPKEIFLFGCNTLAEKGKDSRTQQQYVDVLIHDGYRPDLAMQVAETRYGAVGSTFKDQMRRVFAGVPHIYGFSSVAPAGANVSPDLNRYFRSIPNYSAHLDEMARTTGTNQELVTAMQGTSMTQTSGVGTLANDAGVPYRHQICAMYDEGSSLADRTNVVAKMLLSSDRFIYLNSAVSFLKQNLTLIQGDPESTAVLTRVTHDQATMTEIDRLKTAPTTSVALRLDLMDLDVKLGRTKRSEFVSQAIGILKPLVRSLSQANADLVCSAIRAHDLKMNVRLEDFDVASLTRAAALYAMQCLSTNDERVTEALIPMINDNSVRSNGDNVRAYLLAMTHLPGRTDDKIKVANYTLTYAPIFAPYSYGLLATAETGSAQVRATDMLVKLDVNQAALPYNLFATLPRQQGLAVALLTSISSAQTKQSYRQQMTAILRLMPLDAPYWGNIANEVQKQDIVMQAIFMGIVEQSTPIPAQMTNLATYLLGATDKFGTYFGAVLARSALTTEQAQKVFEIIERNPLSGDAALAKYILSLQSPAVLTREMRKTITGLGYRPVCEVQGDILQCRGERFNLN